MGKIKLNKKDNYTIISNGILKNMSLSLKAKGLYAYMWSLPDDWDYSVAGLVKVLKEGKDAINEALKELEKEGYLVRTILRKSGKFADMDYILHEIPQKPPFTDFPSAGKPLAENPQQLNTNRTKEKNKQNHLSEINGEQAPLEKKNSKEVTIDEIYKDPKNEKIIEALRLYHNWYKESKLGYKASSVAKWANLLSEYSKDDPLVAIEIAKQSIENGWRNIFPLKKSNKYNDGATMKKFDPKTLARDEDGKLIEF